MGVARAHRQKLNFKSSVIYPEIPCDPSLQGSLTERTPHDRAANLARAFGQLVGHVIKAGDRTPSLH